MKTFIFTFALIACLLLAQGMPVDENKTTADAIGLDIPLVRAVDTDRKCKAVGIACSLPDECCSYRCSSYRHRCAS